MIKITKSYEENINLGNYQSARIGITLVSDKEYNDVAQIREASSKLMQLAEDIVSNELQALKDKRNITT